MPILHLCAHAGCKKLIPFNKRYCDKHTIKQKQYGKSWSYSYRKQIYGKYGKFYHSKRWTKMSRAYRAKNPLCVECLKHGKYVHARVVDHIMPIRTEKGWENRWNEDNFQSLCYQCHLKKTKLDQKKFDFPKVKNDKTI